MTFQDYVDFLDHGTPRLPRSTQLVLGAALGVVLPLPDELPPEISERLARLR